jgi:hypothetical protein
MNSQESLHTLRYGHRYQNNLTEISTQRSPSLMAYNTLAIWYCSKFLYRLTIQLCHLSLKSLVELYPGKRGVPMGVV